MEKTTIQYDKIIAKCRSLFENKLHDYGTAWRILRLPSVTDQIYIKAQRIRSLQEADEQKIDEGQASEFIGIINYSLIALVQLQKGVVERPDMTEAEALTYFDAFSAAAKELMECKNHDYGEAWRKMRISSITDLILQKLLRIKQIEDNKGLVKVSEGLDANYLDMVNYAVFSLILMQNEEA